VDDTRIYTKATMERPNKKGEFIFTASTSLPDREGDIVRGDGWELEAFKDGGPLLWSHDQRSLPVGKILWIKVAGEGDEAELIGKARFNETTELAVDVAKLVKSGDLTGISVGFRPLEFETRDEGGREFKSQELLEVSVVNVPANPEARITAFKSLGLKSEPVISSLMDQGFTTKAVVEDEEDEGKETNVPPKPPRPAELEMPVCPAGYRWDGDAGMCKSVSCWDRWDGDAGMCKKMTEAEMKDLPDEADPIGLAVIDGDAPGLTHSATGEEEVETDGCEDRETTVHPRDLALEMIRRAVSDRLAQNHKE